MGTNREGSSSAHESRREHGVGSKALVSSRREEALRIVRCVRCKVEIQSQTTDALLHGPQIRPTFGVQSLTPVPSNGAIWGYWTGTSGLGASSYVNIEERILRMDMVEGVVSVFFCLFPSLALFSASEG